eukprot:Gregarina_sp_Poly_1__524@NODE_1126_length_5010_cov_45_168521_g690_i2_p8_GENE_NODE_1126_length_5010_cov_45_168521_g690_i2NODE_1126_length_5010_cov_45_168521_g690_i2_p8_ORF_typecomplete_len105_score10_05_NODE_1126_length_5010_cov_45_168521_g690_i229633277
MMSVQYCSIQIRLPLYFDIHSARHWAFCMYVRAYEIFVQISLETFLEVVCRRWQIAKSGRVFVAVVKVAHPDATILSGDMAGWECVEGSVSSRSNSFKQQTFKH